MNVRGIFKRLFVEQEGAETAEWVAIVALIVVVAVAVYTGVLKNGLQDVVGSIENKVGNL